MRILKIKHPGLFINLTGVDPVRTPAEIDITNSDLNIILIELRSYGIDNFEILNKADYDKIPKTKRNVDNQEINRSKIKYLDKKFKSNKVGTTYNEDKLVSKFDRIEKLLEELVSIEKNKGTKSNEKNKHLEKSEINDNEPEVEDFIPDVDLSGLKYNKKE